MSNKKLKELLNDLTSQELLSELGQIVKQISSQSYNIKSEDPLLSDLDKLVQQMESRFNKIKEEMSNIILKEAYSINQIFQTSFKESIIEQEDSSYNLNTQKSIKEHINELDNLSKLMFSGAKKTMFDLIDDCKLKDLYGFVDSMDEESINNCLIGISDAVLNFDPNDSISYL